MRLLAHCCWCSRLYCTVAAECGEFRHSTSDHNKIQSTLDASSALENACRWWQFGLLQKLFGSLSLLLDQIKIQSQGAGTTHINIVRAASTCLTAVLVPLIG